MRIITFDVEIAEDVDSKPDRWDAARRGDCGVSSVVLHDSDTGRFHVYGPKVKFEKGHTVVSGYEPMVEAINHLNEADLLVSFNGLDFDVPCLEGAVGIGIFPDHYDILVDVWNAIGEKHKGYGLGPICERTLGIGKSGSGVHAPVLFQTNRFWELIDYNINDVHMTRELFNHIQEEGWILDTSNRKLFLKGQSQLAAA